MRYAAPWWLAGGNAQTIWAAVGARRRLGPPPIWRRERWTAPDGDFVDLDWAAGAGAREGRPLLVLFHGLEGSSRSHYAQAFADFARERGIDFVVPHFRGCSGELNQGPRAYHSGDHEEVGWILARLRQRRRGPLLAVGVCAPLDLAVGSRAIGRGFNRFVYTAMFLRSMKPKALAKLRQHPGLFDAARLAAARDLYQFDDVFTAPLHGFRDADDYYQRASAKPHLHRIRIPALALNARNDPFVPAASLPAAGEVGGHVTLWQPAEGGHVGFPAGPFPGHVRAMPAQVGGWLLEHLGSR